MTTLHRFVLAIVACLGIASPLAAQDWARKMFTDTAHDFGNVARGAKAEFDFKLSNIYVEDVHIVSARSSCGCTSVEVVKPNLKTYEKGAIHATFNTKAFQGQRGATLTVVIDKPFYAEVQLHVSGFIRTDVSLEPGQVALGSVEQGTGTERKVALSYFGRSDWQITDVKSTNPNLTGEVRQTRRAGGQVGYDLIVRLKPDAQPGYINDQILLTTNDSRPVQIPVAVEGRVTSSVTVSPASLFMGVVQPGQQVTKQLVVKASKPFRIVSISCDDPSFRFEQPDDTRPKVMHLVPVTFAAGADPGKINKKIRIVTDLGTAAPELAAYAVVSGP